MRDTIVVDLDGTLADIEHRVPLLHSLKPDWRSFYKSCVNDTANTWCVDLMRGMAYIGFKVIIVSARSREVEAETLDWLQKNEIPYELHMLRAEGDYTQDQVLKKLWLDSYGKERILFVVDDRTRVVDMWRANGLTVLQCARWEEYKRPAAIMIVPEAISDGKV